MGYLGWSGQLVSSFIFGEILFLYEPDLMEYYLFGFQHDWGVIGEWIMTGRNENSY